jgi:serine/threonine-protein kinase
MPIAGFNYPVAELYTLVGDRQQALTWLERSYEQKDFLLPFVNADPIFEGLRAEPRYQAILRRMKLAPRNE